MRPTSLFARVATACLASSLLAGCARADAPTTEAPAATHVGGELAWADWSKASFDRAKQDNRIMLVNVVATWCHWCHVMEETTYVDPDVVSLVRNHFVTDRGQHPVDQNRGTLGHAPAQTRGTNAAALARKRAHEAAPRTDDMR